MKITANRNIPISECDVEQMQNFLRVWCKMISRDHQVTQNSYSKFISDVSTQVANIEQVFL